MEHQEKIPKTVNYTFKLLTEWLRGTCRHSYNMFFFTEQTENLCCCCGRVEAVLPFILENIIDIYALLHPGLTDSKALKPRWLQFMDLVQHLFCCLSRCQRILHILIYAKLPELDSTQHEDETHDS